MDSRAGTLGRALGAGVAAIAVFNTVSELTRPTREPHATLLQAAGWVALLFAHAAIYYFGSQVRARVGVRWYVTVQAALVVAIGLSGIFVAAWIALYFVATVEAVLLAGALWGTAAITIGATVLFAINAAAAWDLYRGASIGLLLATTGFVAHGVAGLIRRRDENSTAANGAAPAAPPTNGSQLTPREFEVLRALVAGAKSSQIASELSITERTVKAHLASIYQKLGVETRSAAVAAAMQRGLVS